MNVCRICLNKRPQKDILQLQVDVDNSKKTCTDIMIFCLEIQVEQDSKISTKLCLKCYKKLLDFDKFKSLAIKNDAYLRSLDVKNEIFIRDDEIIVREDEIIIKTEDDMSITYENNNCQEDPAKHVIGDDINLKTEDDGRDYKSESEDEFLSVIKKIKYEYVEEEVKENAQVTKRKKKKYAKENSIKQMCEECGKTVTDLKAHSYLHMPIAERKRIKCKVCDKMFSSHSARYRHNKIKHLGLKKTCNICSKMVTNLRQHNLVVHNKELLRYECAECERRFISQSLLDLHMRMHTKDRPFGCDQCDKKFANKSLAQQHIRSVHDKEKSHLCQLCSKSFFKKYHLQSHLKTHVKEKEYECPDCGKFYKTPDTLKSHREIHSDARNFGCQLCTQTFKKREYLAAHMLSHTKVKRYPCQYCGVRFHRSDHRKRHEYTAHQKHLLTSATSSTF